MPNPNGMKLYSVTYRRFGQPDTEPPINGYSAYGTSVEDAREGIAEVMAIQSRRWGLSNEASSLLIDWYKSVLHAEVQT